ncbi:DNA-binding response regulator (plasmid) [Fulvitalea axinellae]|uniref:DNA-binding response regulator n=1 Tax=Fulvitalea axinellae TaxID=1182444 RepID=A0AAU9D1H9_9BACT|nr:DNA-binding response regulator [Fulvitalea axinellae]
MEQRKIKCLLVDDEKLSRELVGAYIRKIPALEIVGECSNIIEAKEVIDREQVDLLLLDIEMPNLTGIDFLRMLRNPPVTILITAYSSYAVESYELDVVDYLLKPVEFDRFFKAIYKALEIIAPECFRNDDKRTAERKEAEPLSPNGAEYFFVKSDKNIIKVVLKEILYIESLREYVKIVTKTQSVITLQSLSRLEEILPSNSFQRIHRSFIVNVEKVDKVKGNEVFVGENRLTISKGQREKFINMINTHRLF